MPSSHLIFCHALLLLTPIPPRIRVFSNESTLRISWPKYWSFSFSISPSNEHLGLISFRMDWLDLLAVQGLSRVFSNTTVQKHLIMSYLISFCNLSVLSLYFLHYESAIGEISKSLIFENVQKITIQFKNNKYANFI